MLLKNPQTNQQPKNTWQKSKTQPNLKNPTPKTWYNFLQLWHKELCLLLSSCSFFNCPWLVFSSHWVIRLASDLAGSYWFYVLSSGSAWRCLHQCQDSCSVLPLGQGDSHVYLLRNSYKKEIRNKEEEIIRGNEGLGFFLAVSVCLELELEWNFILTCI